MSFKRPTKWFARFFGNGRRKSIVTWVPVEEAKALTADFDVEAAPPALGTSRVYLENVPQVWALKKLVARSLELSLTIKEETPTEPVTREDPKSALKVVSGP
ncbi:hypothetical protein [Myxococcus qinghaiensis]|uniref:hypothetical protein n=1 Tax=Myxococcus qinghaiensis TaxID=2906758 RepID=UPI0020A6E5CA|nr:hypothetical protein [Myxococcus qinghaiensis]MCP3166306.1 hypothetical protein [Myxococcus qinghaiensis]